jgi:hypothetical protein
MRCLPLASLLLLAVSAPALAQDFPDAQSRIAAQKKGMEPFKPFHGLWRGQAIAHTPTGKLQLTQTERVGPFLDGATTLVEGRGYAPDGKLVFNAFGQIVYDPGTKRYSFRTQAMGYAGDAAVTLIPNGYIWESPAGPGAVMRYTTTLKDGVWHEVGERVVGNAPPVRTFEMTLRRIGDTDWPAANPVPMK